MSERHFDNIPAAALSWTLVHSCELEAVVCDLDGDAHGEVVDSATQGVLLPLCPLACRRLCTTLVLATSMESPRENSLSGRE